MSVGCGSPELKSERSLAAHRILRKPRGQPGAAEGLVLSAYCRKDGLRWDNAESVQMVFDAYEKLEHPQASTVRYKITDLLLTA